MHLEQAADALVLLLGRVVDRRAGCQDAGVDANERELTDERVGHDLEAERGKRRVVPRRARFDRVGALRRIETLDCRHIHRRRQIVDNRVEQRLHALVLECRTADHRHERRFRFFALCMHRRVDALAQRGLDLFFGNLLAVEVLLEDLVVRLADLLDQLLAVVLRLFEHVAGNLTDDVVGAHRLVLVGDRLHLDEIDHADELVFGADGQLNRNRIATELGDDLLERPLEVRADAVHLVDEADARDAVLVGLTPHRLRLRLDAGDRVEHRDRTVEHAQRPLDFGGEVDVSRRIDDVDAVIAPEARRRGRRNGDAAFLLLFHPVHDGRALVDLTNLVGDARVEQDPFRGGGLAGIDVGHDADVARSIERCFPWHC